MVIRSNDHFKIYLQNVSLICLFPLTLKCNVIFVCCVCVEGIVVIKRMYVCSWKRQDTNVWCGVQNGKISTINIYDRPENMRNSSSSSHQRGWSQTPSGLHYHHPSTVVIHHYQIYIILYEVICINVASMHAPAILICLKYGKCTFLVYPILWRLFSYEVLGLWLNHLGGNDVDYGEHNPDYYLTISYTWIFGFMTQSPWRKCYGLGLLYCTLYSWHYKWMKVENTKLSKQYFNILHEMTSQMYLYPTNIGIVSHHSIGKQATTYVEKVCLSHSSTPTLCWW